jgi:VanZ family protein
MRFALAWAPAVAIAALIFWLSAIPGLSVTTGTHELILRKSAHFGIYAALAAACWRGFGYHGLTGRRRVVAAWVLAVAYAISDELHQITVPTRVGSPWDVLVDAAGAACGLAVLLALLPRLRGLRQVVSR